MNFKRIMALISASLLLCLFLLAGCKGNEGGTQSGGGAGTNENGIPALGTIGSDPGKQLGLYVEDGKLMLAGKEFKAIGVNYYDGAWRYFMDPLADDIDAALDRLVEHKVPVARVRFSAWSSEGMDMYKDDPERFFSLVDKCVKKFEEKNIGIIASLAWNPTQYIDYDGGETITTFMKTTDSEGMQRMLKYFKDIIDRYKYSPAIWGWEVGNEYNLNCNVSGCDLSPDVLGAFLDYVCAYIKQYDGSNRVVTSGFSQNRGCSYNLWKNGSWTDDTEEQEHAVMDEYLVENIDMHSIHTYAPLQRWNKQTVSIKEYLEQNIEHCASKGKVLYIGEYCDDKHAGTEDDSLAVFQQIHDGIVDAGVPLAMIWMYSNLADRWLEPTRYEEYELDCALDANTKYRDAGVQDIDAYWNSVTKVMG